MDLWGFWSWWVEVCGYRVCAEGRMAWRGVRVVLRGLMDLVGGVCIG
jgi:hypothetical protein